MAKVHIEPHHADHLHAIGIPRDSQPAALDVHDDEYKSVRESWKETLPQADHETLRMKTVGTLAWRRHSTGVSAPSQATVPHVSQVTDGTHHQELLRLVKAAVWLGSMALFLLLCLLAASVFAPRAHGQYSKINSITASNNDNSQQGFFASPFTFKAGANCSFSVSGTVATFNCSGGAAGAGGSNTQLQYNSTGSLAGISTLTTDGTIVTQKVGTNLLFADPTDATKKIQFDASGVSAATTRTVAFPDANSRTIKNGVTTGQIPIWNNVTGTFDVSDPLVQGTTAEGAAIPNPVVIGGKDGSGNNKALVLDSSGRPTVNVNGTVAVSLASAPTTAVTIADAADVTLGAKADAKSTATDTTEVTLMQVLKEISAMEQAPASRAVTNAGTFAVQATLQANSGVDIGKLTANQSVNQAQIGGTTVVADPCQANAKVYLPISLTSSTQIVSGTSAKKIYICSLNLISAAADNIALVEGTGSVCATGIAGMAGGTTAATGWNFAANGGMTLGSGTGAVIAEATNADNMCLLVSGATQVSGSIAYVVQ